MSLQKCLLKHLCAKMASSFCHDQEDKDQGATVPDRCILGNIQRTGSCCHTCQLWERPVLAPSRMEGLVPEPLAGPATSCGPGRNENAPCSKLLRIKTTTTKHQRMWGPSRLWVLCDCSVPAVKRAPTAGCRALTCKVAASSTTALLHLSQDHIQGCKGI